MQSASRAVSQACMVHAQTHAWVAAGGSMVLQL